MPKISKLSIVAGVAELVASAGSAAVVGNLVKATTPYDLNKFQKGLVAVGGYVIGGVLSDLSAKYIRAQIEEYATKARAVFNPAAEAAAREDTKVEPTPTETDDTQD